MSLLHILGYVKNTIDYSLTYSRNIDITPLAYVDADYGGCRDTCRSTSGYVFTMAGGAVLWSSKRQGTVALSTVEAEYVVMSCCAQQMVWMHTWLNEVQIEHILPGVIRGDSRGAITLAKTTKDHGKVKHINIHHHYLQELVKSELGNVTGNPQVSQTNPYPYPQKPVPVTTGTGNGFTHGFPI